MLARSKSRAIGFGMLVAGVLSAAPAVWWLSIIATMRGPHTEPQLSDTLSYIALSAPFLIIPALAIVRALMLIVAPERQPGQKLSLLTPWLWVLLLINPIGYILWLMLSLEGM